jgi:cytoskeleton protein RodZ
MSQPDGQIEAATTSLTLQGVGQILKQAREKAGLTVEEAATQLRISPNQVRALESGDSSALPTSVYARGFVRNYAKLLRINAQPLVQAYSPQLAESGKEQIIPPSKNITVGRERRTWLLYALASIALIVALGGWVAYMDYFASRGEKNVPVTPAEVSVPTMTEAQPGETLNAIPVEVPAPAAETSPPPMPEALPPPAVVTPSPAAVAAPAVAAPVTPTSTIRLVFSESSWVGVRDSGGKEVFNKTVPAGESAVIGGVPPLKVIIGNAKGVQATFNDKPVDLAPHIVANVARMTLE